MFKKLIAVGTTTALTLAMAVSAFAAGSINADEQRILDELNAKNVPAKYVAQVKEVLEAEGTDVTKADADTAIANIDEAKKLVGDKTPAEIKADADLYKKVQNLVNSTATLKSVDVKVNWDATTGQGSVVKADTTATQTTNKDGIKKTGVDFSTTAAVVAGLGLSVAGIAVIAKKKDLVNA